MKDKQKNWIGRIQDWKRSGMLNAPWLTEIEESNLQPGDLIFVDVPGKEKGKIIRDKESNPVYGVFNHVMTYISETKDGHNLITTENDTKEGGDFRINEKSTQRTMYYKFSVFKSVSARAFESTTRYKYMRINWTYLFYTP